MGGLKKEPTDRKKPAPSSIGSPDKQVFTDINIPVEYYRDVLRRQAVVNKGITFRFRNQVGGKFQQEEYCYPGGIKQYIEELVGDNAFTMPVYWGNRAPGTGCREPAGDETENYSLVLLLQAGVPH